MLALDTTFTTPNFDKNRDGTPFIIRPAGLLLHTGGGDQESDLHELLGKSGRQVSSNIYVNRRGTVYQLAPDNHRTWHAGVADRDTKRWWGNTAASYGIIDGNTLIGIEIEHRRGADYPAVQMDAIEAFCREKIEQYNFPITRIGAHKWYRPSIKKDPEDWVDSALQEWIRSLYTQPGSLYRVIEPRGARIRQGPGTAFATAAMLDCGTTFWSDKTIDGELIDGSDDWVHFRGPSREIVAELGFVWSSIVEEVV